MMKSILVMGFLSVKVGGMKSLLRKRPKGMPISTQSHPRILEIDMNDYQKELILWSVLYLYALAFILWAFGVSPYNPIPFFWK